MGDGAFAGVDEWLMYTHGGRATNVRNVSGATLLSTMRPMLRGSVCSTVDIGLY